jgi:hypothetical protein
MDYRKKEWKKIQSINVSLHPTLFCQPALKLYGIQSAFKKIHTFHVLEYQYVLRELRLFLHNSHYLVFNFSVIYVVSEP